MICSNLSVLNKIARSSLSRNLVSQISTNHSCRIPTFNLYHTKPIRNPLTGSWCEQRLLFEPLTRTRHELTFVRWQFDFNKKASKAIPRKASWFSGSRKLPKTSRERNLTTLLYLFSLAIMTAGASYAAVPLYRVFCQVMYVCNGCFWLRLRIIVVALNCFPIFQTSICSDWKEEIKSY